MYNLDQLLSYLVFMTIVTFIFERIIENFLIPLIPAKKIQKLNLSENNSNQKEINRENSSPPVNIRTYLTLFLIFTIGLGLALSNPKFRLLTGGLGVEAIPLVDSIFTAALMAGGSQPLHSIVEQIRKK
jgi:hypothetical protein